MTIDEALDKLMLFRDTEQPRPDWRWYQPLGIRNNDELAEYRANVAAGLGG